MTKQRSPRLRKKLFLDEFSVLGFEFSSDIDEGEGKFDDLIDGLIEFFDKRNLFFSGGGGVKSISGFVCSNDRYGSTTKDDQTALEQWLGTIDSASNIKVGPLVDANQII